MQKSDEENYAYVIEGLIVVIWLQNDIWHCEALIMLNCRINMI